MPARPVAPPSRPTPLVVLLTLLGVGTIVVAGLGPLGLGVIRYHVSDGALLQMRGGDIAGLLLVGPVSLAAARVLRRGPSQLGYALGAAPAAYGLYTDTQLTICGDLARYGGNSERFFPLLAGMVAVSGATLVLAAAGLARTPAPPPHRLDRVAGWYLLLASLFLAVGVHLPGLLDAWGAHPTGEEYAADPGLFWIVKLMDLGLVLPTLTTIGVALLRGHAWARLAAAPALGGSALMSTAVAGMAVSMWVTGSAGASAGVALGFVVVAGAALALAATAYRRLTSPRTPPAAGPPAPRAARPGSPTATSR